MSVGKFTSIKRGKEQGLETEVEVPVVWKEKEKGDAKGQQYPTVDMIVYKPGEAEDELGDIDVEATKNRLVEQVIPFLGWDFVAKSLQAKFNLMSQNAVAAAEETDMEGKGTGVTNLERLYKFLQDLSARTESIPEMEKRMKELANEMSKLFVVMMPGSGKSEQEIAAAQSRGLKISAEITRLNNTIEARKRGPRDTTKEKEGATTSTPANGAQPVAA